MYMTHYMELLMINSPWNLLLFMALPVVLAETLAITELIIVFNGNDWPKTIMLNKITGILAGIVFLCIAIYLLPSVVVPITIQQEWRSWIDVLAVGAYLAGAIPMILISLMNLNLILKNKNFHQKTGFSIVCVSIFLVVSHIAMIAGMADPQIAGWQPSILGLNGGARMNHESTMEHGTMNNDHTTHPHGSHDHSAHDPSHEHRHHH